MASVPSLAVTLYQLMKHDDDVSIGDCIWDIARIMTWDQIDHKQPSCSVIILLTPAMTMMFILVNLYMGEYTAQVTEPKHETPPIESYEQLYESDLKILPYGHYYNDLVKKLNGTKGEVEKLEYDKNRDNPELLTLKKMFAVLDMYANTLSTPVAQRLIKLHLSQFPGPRKFYFSKERDSTLRNRYLHMPKDSLHKEAFTYNMMLIQDVAILDYAQNANISMELAWDRYNHREYTSHFIKVDHIVGSFLVLLVGFSLAFISFSMENILKGYQHRKITFPADNAEEGGDTQNTPAACPEVEETTGIVHAGNSTTLTVKLHLEEHIAAINE